MRYVKATPLEVGYRVWQLRPPQPSISIAVKGTFDPVAGDVAAGAPFAEEQLPTTGEAHWEDDVERSLRHASDLPLFKPKGECFVVGKAWAPGGRPASSVACRFQIGAVDKSFLVFGDRRWERGLIQRLTAPEPFVSMDLSMERAFGGPGYAANPFGRGRASADGETPLPNLEQTRQLIDSPSSKPAPVIVGPLPMMWPARSRFAGTYDATYMRERWPWLPADFDWRFYLAAPPDQQLREGFWRGDERVSFEGLHPSVPRVQARLPCIQPRVCLDYAGMDRFQEIQTVLDTVVWDAEIGKLICVWRGMAEVPSETLDELAHIFVAHDPLGGPHRSTAELRAEMQRLLAEEEAEETEAEGEEPPEPDDQPHDPSEAEDARGQEDEEGDEPSATDRELDEKIAQMQAQMKELGIEAQTDSPPRRDPTALLAQLRATGAPLPDGLPEMIEELERASSEPLDTAEPSPPAPVAAPPSPEGRALVEALLARDVALIDLDLTGVDFRGLDLSDRDVSGSILSDADLRECKLRGLRAHGTILAGADLTRADLSGADLTEADFSGARLDGANLDASTLTDTDFEDASLRMATLRRVVANRAGFVNADLEGSTLSEGDFTEADFEGAKLMRAQATACTFREASLEGADASGATFDRAIMTGARGEGLAAEEARFGSIDAEDSFWERARLSRSDFSFSKLTRADFSDAVLIGAEMDGCALRQARFERANAHGLQARKADMMEANCESADFTFADLRGANLFGAELWRANLRDAALELAILTRTKRE